MHDVAVTAVKLGGKVVAEEALLLGIEMMLVMVAVMRLVPVVDVKAEYDATTEVQFEKVRAILGNMAP